MEAAWVEKQYSGFGIASFVLSLVAGVSMFLLFAAASFIEMATPGGMSEESVEAVLVGLLLFALLFLDLLAIGLGVAGLFQHIRRKVFAVLGTALAGATILIALLLLALGSMV